MRIVESAAPGIVADVEPARPDHRNQHRTRLQRPFDGIDEIDPGIDGLDVAEDPDVRQLVAQMVAQATGGALAVLASIADEDVLHAELLRGVAVATKDNEL